MNFGPTELGSARFYSFLMPRRSKKIFLLSLCLFIGAMIYVNLKFVSKEEDPLAVEFSFGNKPYGQLKNGTCVLQENNEWNCPDIRGQGPYVIRQMQLVMMRMLLMFDALAKKYKLRYWITRGTLLGAARHHSSIPWDSDIDFEMPIEDYLKFLVHASMELPSDTFLQQHEEEKQFFRFVASDDILHMNSHQKQKLANIMIVPWNPRLRDKKSCYKNCLKMKCPWEDGLQIDIYPILLQGDFYQDQFVRSKLKKLWRLFGRIFGFNTGDYKAFPLRRLQFEGFEIPVPNQWEAVLRNIYGNNYMKLPPKEKQLFYEKQLPDPLRACSEYDEDGNLKTTTKR